MLTVLTEEELRYFSEDRDRLSLISNRETNGSSFLFKIFIVAVSFIASSKLISFRYGDEINQFVSEVIVDTMFELGAALIGAVATVYFIEKEQKKQLRKTS